MNPEFCRPGPVLRPDPPIGLAFFGSSHPYLIEKRPVCERKPASKEKDQGTLIKFNLVLKARFSTRRNRNACKLVFLPRSK